MTNVGSATYSYEVADPTWIWYDTGGTGYTGWATYNWGPLVYFENPFYGTGNAMQLLTTDGALHNNTAGNGNTIGNLHVYGDDGVNMFDLITPVPVNFVHRTYTTFDLSSYNIQVTTPWFWISYEDLGTNRYFLYDSTYDYTSPLYLVIGGVINGSTSTGEWCIGAQVQTGEAIPDAPVVTITTVAGSPVLNWPADPSADHFNVYGADDPYTSAPWTLLGSPTTNSFTYTGTEAMKFFQVYADSMARGGRGISSPLSQTTQRIIEAAKELKTN